MSAGESTQSAHRTRRLAACVVALGALGAGGVAAQEASPAEPASGWSGSVSLANHYVTRGLDVSVGLPAAQGALEYLTAAGFYVDGSAEQIHYFGMNAEADAAIGMRRTDGRLQVDWCLYYYGYPGADPALHANFGEAGLRLGLSLGRVTPIFETYVSPNYFFASGHGLFVNTGADIAAPGGITAGLRFGYMTVADNRAFQYPDYTTWVLSATRTFAGLAWSVQLTDNSMRRSQCLNEDRCALRLTVRLAKSF